MEIKDDKFKSIKQEAEKIYKNIDEVLCPYFGSNIVFNAKGLENIKFKSKRKARSREDQYMRLKLIPLASRILEKSHTLQGISEKRSLEYEKINSRWEYVMKNSTYYEFVAVVKRVRVKVIIKQVENGPKYFLEYNSFLEAKK